MEDPKLPVETQVPKPPNPTPQTDLPQSKKRKIDEADLRNSKHMKIRAIVKDLRPSFIEALNAPDFRNCKAADEIRKQMQVVMEVAKQLSMEKVSSGNPKISPEGEAMVAGTQDVPLEKCQDEKAEQPQPEKVPEKAVEVELQGSYVIGGSPVGWNFMMYPGSKAVYYGETKVSFVARRAKSSTVTPGS